MVATRQGTAVKETGEKKVRGEPHFFNQTKADPVRFSELRSKFGK
jgi:hypothetical protein